MRWRAFLRGVLSVFDIGGSHYSGGEVPPRPRTADEAFAADREAIRSDWQGLLPPGRDR